MTTKKSKSQETKSGQRNAARFVLCVHNNGNVASLELFKLYRVLPDLSAAKHHLLRVVDESGEDYLYPDSYFVKIAVPQAAKSYLLGEV